MKGLYDLAVTHYKRLVDNSRWPPLTTVPKKQVDALPEIFNASASMPSAFQAITDELKLLRRDMEKDKSVGFRDLSNVTCYKCGKKGHLKPNCPDNANTVT